MKKKRMVVNLPKNAGPEIHMRMVQEGYNMREKSKWVSESIETFIAMKDYRELVKMAELIDNFVKQETIYITPELEDKLNNSIIHVRKKYPALEAVQSLIVRASITRRLVLLNNK